ncbi:DNA-binding protein [Kocuria rosea]|uniref:DNA-binding protein n=1 Tax=Kocuria rosea TaxID=1275 RepID=A0A4R5Y2B9_KOCRO|nr:DNA-binding protein [Kocuria rosea]
MSTAALADYLDVSTRTVVRWRESLSGPPFVRAGTAIRYRPADVEKWLSASTMTPLRSAA